VPGNVQGRAVAGAWTETGGLHVTTQAQAAVQADGFTSPNPNASGTANAATLFRDVVVLDVPQAATSSMPARARATGSSPPASPAAAAMPPAR
jgi:hypothetical protein